MNKNRALRILAINPLLMVLLACSSSQQRSVETSNVNTASSPSPEIGRVEKAKALIDDNVDKLIPIIEKIESANKDKNSLLAMRQSVVAELEPLAIKEAEMYLSLTPAERFEVFQFMQSRLADSKSDSVRKFSANSPTNATVKDRFFNALESVDIPVNRKLPSKEVFDNPPEGNTRPALFQAERPKRAECVGFLVGHRRCCENHVGNGVCFGSPEDCFHGLFVSDSCPPCRSCPDL